LWTKLGMERHCSPLLEPHQNNASPWYGSVPGSCPGSDPGSDSGQYVMLCLYRIVTVFVFRATSFHFRSQIHIKIYQYIHNTVAMGLYEHLPQPTVGKFQITDPVV
jgi:hypothetical protein